MLLSVTNQTDSFLITYDRITFYYKILHRPDGWENLTATKMRLFCFVLSGLARLCFAMQMILDKVLLVSRLIYHLKTQS